MRPATALAVLKTKLHRPSIATRSLARPRLLDQLDRGLESPVTLISAPAGYGKSILASQWMERASLPSAWLSLDESDSDPRAFLGHFVAAIRTLAPDALSITKKMTEAPELPVTRALLTSLANELDTLSMRAVLVLDDYHNISSKAVHELMSGLVTHPPAGVHMVLVTRYDPPLPIVSLRAHGQLSEIRARELAFTQAEALGYLRRSNPLVTEEVAAALVKKTEGWAAGLRLAQAALAHPDHNSAVLPAFGPLDERSVREYLITDVLAREPRSIQQGLLKSSVAGRLCASLCDVLVAGDVQGERVSGSEFVEWLRRSNLFVIPLDPQHRWFRYHHLFQEMLREELLRREGPDRVNELHRRASGWYGTRGLIEEAIDHALAGADPESAAQLVAEHCQELIDDEMWARLQGWLGKLPSALVDGDPALLVARAWLLGDGLSQHVAMASVLDRAEIALARSPSPAVTGTLEGSIEALRAAYVELVGGNAEAAVRGAARANRLLSAEDNRNLSFALVVQTVALQASGHLQAALDLAQSTIEDERFRSQRWNWAPSAWSLPYVGWLETDLRLQCQYASALWRQGQDRQLPDTIAHGCYFLGIAAYERNELLDAEEHLSTLVDAKYEVRPIVYLNGAFALALCHQARGEPAEATRVIDAAMGFALDGVGDFLMPAVEAFQSELSMRQGRWAEAAQWAERVDPYPPRWQYMFYEPVVTLAKALLAQGSEAADDRAAELLERYEAFAESLHIRPLLIQLLGLRAIACEAQGDDQRALQALGRAISLSLPGGAVRFLADLGPALVGPLNRLDAAGEELAHVGSILAAIAPHGGEGRSREGGAVGRLGVPVSGSETLTERELEVLTLLDRRLSNKEIARELMIAPSTVKKHTISLYQKLHVSGRREAAEKARALGYLDDD